MPSKRGAVEKNLSDLLVLVLGSSRLHTPLLKVHICQVQVHGVSQQSMQNKLAPIDAKKIYFVKVLFLD